MTFATRTGQDGQGRALRFDFSVDDWATVAYRYSDVAGKLDGSNWYEARVAACGPLRRGFGQQRIAAAGNVDVVLDNTDGALDWMATRTSMSSLAKLRVRIYLCLYDPAAPGTIDSKQLGEYQLQDWPKRSASDMRISLADAISCGLGAGIQLPTLADFAFCGTNATNPLRVGTNTKYNGYAGAVGPYTPIQLAFGEDWMLCVPPMLADDSSVFATLAGGTEVHQCFVPVCVTTDTGTAASQTEITDLRVRCYTDVGTTGVIPEYLNIAKVNSATGVDNWTVFRSPVITIDGKSYVVIYLGIAYDVFELRTFGQQVSGTVLPVPPFFSNFGGYDPSYAPLASWNQPRRLQGSATINGSRFRLSAGRVANWWVKGVPLSARTTPGSVRQHACDVITDLATYYTKSNPTVEATSRARVKASCPDAAATGLVQPWTMYSDTTAPPAPLPARAVLSKLCQSSDIDIFMNWDGQLAFSADIADFALAAAYAAGTLLNIPEERIAEGFADWIPGDGERGAAFNQVYFSGGRSSPAEPAPMPFQGPIVAPTTTTSSISSADRLIPITLEQGWRPFVQQSLSPWLFRGLDVNVRLRIRFRTDIAALQLDLGDFFRLTWTRNIASVYAGTVFQVEALTFSPPDDAVEIEAIWRDDVAQDKAYLLDNQTFALRKAGGGGRNITLTGGSTTVAFSSGSLITDGVAAGDILRVYDATEATETYDRNRCLLIASITDATHLVVNDVLGAAYFGAAGPYTVTTWDIYRGATTYHTAITDPTNYPSGGDMYGKMVINSGGLYSNGATGNKLLTG